MPVLAYAATAVPATMDGGGVLYDTKDPFEVARLMAAILDDADVEDAVDRHARTRRWRGCARKDFAGTLLRFVDQVRATPPRPAPEVPYDFWPMFDQAERLEELRQFRPAVYRALPRWTEVGGPEARVEHRAPRSPTSNSDLRSEAR